jgi:hypothetical protein
MEKVFNCALVDIVLHGHLFVIFFGLNMVNELVPSWLVVKTFIS